MKKKKVVSLVAVGAMLATTLAGCGVGGQTPSNTPVSSEPAASSEAPAASSEEAKTEEAAASSSSGDKTITVSTRQVPVPRQDGRQLQTLIWICILM